MQTRLVIGLSLVLVAFYSLAHSWWQHEHPPMLNDDHFITETILTQIENPALYPEDLAWSNSDFRRSNGFLFLLIWRGSLQLSERYAEAFPYLTFICLLVYISGWYLFIYEVLDPDTTSKRIRYPFANPDDEPEIDLRRHWVALTLAIGSTMPIYLYVTFANWGLTSIYAHVFVTTISGWAFWGLLKLLKRNASPYRWAGYGFAVGLAVYLNPVNGGGLGGILSAVLIVEALSRRIAWQKVGVFIGAVILTMLPYVIPYFQTQSTDPSSQAEIEAATAFLVERYATRIYPWTLNPKLAPVLLATVIGLVLVVLTVYRRQNPPRWFTLIFVAIHLLLPYFLIGHPVFLLIFAYWWFRTKPNKVDRWDRLFFAMLVAVNLMGPVLSALSQYLWVERHLNPFYTLTYEPIRLTRWVFVPIYAILARWIYQLMVDTKSQTIWFNWMGSLAILATLWSIFGSANPVKDDAVLMKTFLPVRWALPLFVIGMVYLKDREHSRQAKQATWLIFMGLGVAFALGMGALGNLALGGSMVLFVLLLALSFAIQHIPLNLEPEKIVAIGGLVLFVTLTVIFPIAGYHKFKPDLNWCDPPFLENCVPKADVYAAGDWFKANTPLESYVLVLGLQPERFQPLAERSTAHLNHNQIYWFQGSGALLAALPLADQLAGTNPLRSDYKGDDYLLAQVESLALDYVVIVGKGYSLDLPIVYENESVIIYES